MKTTEVSLKNGKKAYAHKDKGGLTLAQINDPVVLTRWQLMVILALLIFIALAVILISVVNLMFMQEVANALLREINSLASGLGF